MSFSQKKSSEKVSVDKSILSIQTGYFGTWINHELKLHNQFALRTEVGTEYRLKFAIKQSFDSLKNQVSIFLEPKYYFNLTKRESKEAHRRSDRACRAEARCQDLLRRPHRRSH